MEMIHSENLIYEYDKRDEEGNVIGTNRAIDGVDIDVPQVTMLAEELRNRGLDLPRGILRREELVEALCQLS